MTRCKCFDAAYEGGVLYLVSLQTAEYLFWLREAGGAEPHDSATRIAFEAATLAGRTCKVLPRRWRRCFATGKAAAKLPRNPSLDGG